MQPGHGLKHISPCKLEIFAEFIFIFFNIRIVNVILIKSSFHSLQQSEKNTTTTILVSTQLFTKGRTIYVYQYLLKICPHTFICCKKCYGYILCSCVYLGAENKDPNIDQQETHCIKSNLKLLTDTLKLFFFVSLKCQGKRMYFSSNFQADQTFLQILLVVVSELSETQDEVVEDGL